MFDNIFLERNINCMIFFQDEKKLGKGKEDNDYKWLCGFFFGDFF